MTFRRQADQYYALRHTYFLGDTIAARRTNTAVLKATGKTVMLQNVWLFEVAGGRLVSAQLCADPAAIRSSAG
jgi:hypothetical protein